MVRRNAISLYTRKRGRSTSRSTSRYRSKRFKKTFSKRRTYNRTYKRRGYGRKTVSSIRTSCGSMNVVLNHPLNATGYNPSKPIGAMIGFHTIDPTSNNPPDVILSHDVLDTEFGSFSSAEMIPRSVYLKYKALYKYIRCVGITCTYVPAITQGAMPSAEEVEGVPFPYSEALSGFITVDMTRDYEAYMVEFPLTASGQADGEGKSSSKSYSMYKSWKKTFKPSIHQNKLPNNDPINCLLKDRISPWCELDDYGDNDGPNYNGCNLVLRMRMPTYAGRPYEEFESTNYAYPPYGYSALVGRLQITAIHEFKGLRY
nr:MAG: putative capsid protein [Arizlama virus]